MKYVALLSGGKDSCFNLIHCARNGHELVAAASVRPNQGKEELDSYLYQTVGQDAIHLVAEALGVPLYRRIIAGSAVEQGAEYGTREGGSSSGIKGDETEDLYELLSEVKKRHPDVQGVSIGAILSNYQRVRVEHVCHRLSLTPLCYLWQRDQDELLSEMIASGLEAVLIKVAGIGLKPRHLGQTIADMQITLRHLNELYGAHICGEGGEYETLTLDSPMFRKRIILKEVETVIHSDNAFATVAYLRIKNASLEEKEIGPYVPVSTPPLLDPEHRDLEMHLRDGNMVTSSKSGRWVVVSNIQSPEGSTRSIDEEVTACFRLLQERLLEYFLRISDLAFVNVFISDMSTFPEVNRSYKAFFGTSPPVRACVAVDLPPDINVRLDCIAYRDVFNERRALHVQGLSYWAPANIGPYSQAVVVGDRIFVSGQIGMRPSDLALPFPSDFALEAALAFQHVHRILAALKETYGASWAHKIQSLICWLVDISFLSRARRISKALDSYAYVPTLFVGAKSLPKGALLEAQVIAHTGQYASMEDGETEIRKCSSPIFNKGFFTSDACTVHWEVSTFTEVSAFCGLVAIKGRPQSEAEQLKSQVNQEVLWTQTYSVRLFHRGYLNEQVSAFVKNLFSSASCPAVTNIPVRFIANSEADDWDLALCLVGLPPDSVP
ncbi:hypothetical protein ACEPAI_6139 [Sanghuangporus weigelae]